MEPVSIVLMIIIVGGSWTTLICALRKMIKMGNEAKAEEE